MRRILMVKGQEFAPVFPGRITLRTELHLARKLWHMLMGLMIVALYLAGTPRETGVLFLGLALGLCLFLETLRLRSSTFNEQILRVWGPLMRANEVNRMSGTPYYIASSLVAFALFPKSIAVLSILYLAVGDPVASLVGIRWGHLSFRLPNGKSLIGTLAGVLTCSAITAVGLQGAHLEHWQFLAMIAVGGLAGGGAEVLPLEVDDNFSIPIVSGFVLWLALILISL